MMQRLFHGLYNKKGRVHSLENGVMKKFIKITFDNNSMSGDGDFIHKMGILFKC